MLSLLHVINFIVRYTEANEWLLLRSLSSTVVVHIIFRVRIFSRAPGHFVLSKNFFANEKKASENAEFHYVLPILIAVSVQLKQRKSLRKKALSFAEELSRNRSDVQIVFSSNKKGKCLSFYRLSHETQGKKKINEIN